MEGLLDRRCDPRDDGLRSLERLLARLRAASHVEALALADAEGLVIAGAGARAACEALGADAALAAAAAPARSTASAANDTVPDRLDHLTRRTRVRRLTVHGVEVLLAARSDQALPDLASAAAACERILRERARG
ncbi:MAG: hypothetical protein IT376_05700 [Polyangiaceae bacterium]|nr:hypothetical protein [Polyangiaceae bacterium]